MSKHVEFGAMFLPEPNTGCWLWIGGLRGEYGRYGKNQYAHRLAYEMAHGPIPLGMSVLHRCDTPLCVNPDHLFLGTQGDNVRDCYAKGRHPGAAQHALCAQGHSMDGAYVAPNGDRRCRTCRLDYKRLWRAKAKRGNARG